MGQPKKAMAQRDRAKINASTQDAVRAGEVAKRKYAGRREGTHARQALSETSHYTKLRRQIGKAKQLDSCSVTMRPEGKLGSEQKQNREVVRAGKAHRETAVPACRGVEGSVR